MINEPAAPAKAPPPGSTRPPWDRREQSEPSPLFAQPTPRAARPATPHPARWAGLIVGVVLCCVALLFGRPDVALLGVPLVLLGVWPTGAGRSPKITLTPDASRLRLVADADAIRLRLISSGYRDATVLVRPGTIDVSRPFERTGPMPELIVDGDAHGAGLLTDVDAFHLVSTSIIALPKYSPLPLAPEARRPRGLTGPAVARRPGEGFELRDVHPMGPGDTTRRIDWHVTARQSTADPLHLPPGPSTASSSPDLWLQPESLWVRGTFASGEAVAVLILDSRDEVGPNLQTWGGLAPLRPDEATSLDFARNAAVTIARRLIENGNRVGLADLATGRRLLTPATGRRHLERLTYALALSAPIGAPRQRVRPPQVPTDAIVYLFSTLLDDAPVQLAARLATTGHQVVVIDTLPPVRPVASLGLELAWRVTAAEQAGRIRRLRAHHVPVVGWTGDARAQAPTSLAAIYRAVRQSRGPAAAVSPATGAQSSAKGGAR